MDERTGAPAKGARKAKAPRGRTDRELRLEIGCRIARCRQARGWLQKDLAARIGVRLGRLSLIENGHLAPNVGELVRLGEALGLSLDDLVKGGSWERRGGRVMSLGNVLRMARIDSPEEAQMVGRFLAALVVLFQDADGAANDPPAAGEEGAHEK